jgi:hypothetical protein
VIRISGPVLDIGSCGKKMHVERPESYDSNRAKSCVFFVHENVRAVLHLLPPFSPTQSAQKERIKHFSRHLSTNFIFLVTSEIFLIADHLASEIQTVEIRVISLERHLHS